MLSSLHDSFDQGTGSMPVIDLVARDHHIHHRPLFRKGRQQTPQANAELRMAGKSRITIW
jgi:hypothetical protein